MRLGLSGIIVRLAVFGLTCGLAAFALVGIFANLRLQSETTYRALFSNISGLKEGDFVRIAGVEVGKVKRIAVQPDTTVLVDFSTESSVALTEGTKAVIRYQNLIGDRFLALEEGTGSTTRLKPGDTLGLAQTSPALDLDALIGGFRPLFRVLEPREVNSLAESLIAALQGQGPTIRSFLAQTATVTAALADRDQLIGEVIDNLQTVLSSLGEQSGQLDKTVTALADLTKALADRRSDVSTGLAYADAAASELAELLGQGRAPLKETVHQADRVSEILNSDLNRLDNVLHTLPDKYKLIGAQGRFGDYFAFYLCDAYLKLNGKGGQPVYIKIAGQDTGRCAPK
ncbi:MlaD family protein [Mycolicibacterium thermoresistibile]|jgi:phospholipid/cholesterol/gamma-HCH transport system substrate-binding protein